MSIEEMRTYLANRDQGDAAAPDQIVLLERQRQRLDHQARDLAIRQRHIEHKLRYWRAVQAGDDDARSKASVEVKQIAAILPDRKTPSRDSERSK